MVLNYVTSQSRISKFMYILYIQITEGLVPRKRIEGRFGFWILRRELWIPGTGFRLISFSMELGFQDSSRSLVGGQFPIPCELYSTFQSPRFRILWPKFVGFRILQAKISWIPKSRLFFYMGRKVDLMTFRSFSF